MWILGGIEDFIPSLGMSIQQPSLSSKGIFLEYPELEYPFSWNILNYKILEWFGLEEALNPT